MIIGAWENFKITRKSWSVGGGGVLTLEMLSINPYRSVPHFIGNDKIIIGIEEQHPVQNGNQLKWTSRQRWQAAILDRIGLLTCKLNHSFLLLWHLK